MKNAIITETASVGKIKMPYAAISGQKREPSKNLVILPGLSIKQLTPSAAAVGRQYKAFVENGYSVYLFDRRINAPSGYSVPDMAEDTYSVLKSLGVEKAEFFGASQGGMIAACIAIMHPETVSHLMLGSTTAKCREQSGKLFGRWISLAEKRKEKELIEAMGSSVYSKAIWDKFKEVFIAANAGITEDEYERFIIMTKAAVGFDCSEKLADISADTLVIASEGDCIFSVGEAEYIAENTGCESFFYDKSFGHAVYDEAPDYAERLYDFCTRGKGE